MRLAFEPAFAFSMRRKYCLLNESDYLQSHSSFSLIYELGYKYAHDILDISDY